jgi:hypothetical protein
VNLFWSLAFYQQNNESAKSPVGKEPPARSGSPACREHTRHAFFLVGVSSLPLA